MVLKIRQNEGKWILEIIEEKWAFENRKEFEDLLKHLLDLKEKHGRIW